jgi:hypothetical protein
LDFGEQVDDWGGWVPLFLHHFVINVELLNKYCSMVRAVTREKPVMWFSMGFRKIGSLMALTICCFIALSKLLDVLYSSNYRLWDAFLSSHCWGKKAAGLGGSGPGFGGLLYGVAVTVR